jgi:tetratricopeptide (TPR) repeat protein
MSLDVSPTTFAVLSAINTCGYDSELAASLPLRQQVRREINAALKESPEGVTVTRALCDFYRDHQQPDSARELAQYVSLAFNVSEPPDFALLGKEADLPPDAAYVLGFLPLLQRFHNAAGLQKIWDAHRPELDNLVARYHEPVSRLLFETEIYLKLPSSGYVGRSFNVVLDPMGAPSQINARNYGADYHMLVSPGTGPLKLDQIRHTYLHYLLDPMALKRAKTMQRLEPLLEAVANAPVDKSFKHDISLLLTESLVRAVEARLIPKGKNKDAESARQKAAEAAMAEGYILTRYFYEALMKFEQEPVGLRDAYPDWLHFLNVEREKERAAQVRFAAKAAPELVRASNAPREALLDEAERRLASGDLEGAKKLAQDALDRKREDPARALFVLARAATLSGDVQGARTYFGRTLEIAREPRLVAWSHIYLGRISDLQEEREAALKHYRAALTAGDPAPETKAAAERGIKQAYSPPKKQ